MKHILRYAPIAAALLLITSCASKKAITDGTQLPTQTSKTDKNAEKEAARQSLQFVQRIANNNVATENILTSGDFTLQLGSKEITVPAKLSMRKDECIRIQLLMPILRSELARIEFTPNYVLLLDRYHKEYIKASYSEVSFLANNGLSFYSLQALFWNQLIAPGAKTVTSARDAQGWQHHLQVERGRSNSTHQGCRHNIQECCTRHLVAHVDIQRLQHRRTEEVPYNTAVRLQHQLRRKQPRCAGDTTDGITQDLYQLGHKDRGIIEVSQGGSRRTAPQDNIAAIKAGTTPQ